MNDTSLLSQIKIGVEYLYNSEFEKAKETYDLLLVERPNHPVTPFFLGLATYWGNYPLPESGSVTDDFIAAMQHSIKLSDILIEDDENNIEGIFFDVVSRAMLMMLYSDRGHSSKVIKLAPTSYRHLLKSFEFKDVFKEFYFITGLYSYYIEAYPEKNPVYKPVSLLFKGGDMEEGLKELHFALDSSIFVQVEAGIFLAGIYYDFELNHKMAIKIVKDLYNRFPNNPYFLSQYIEYLLDDGQYEVCLILNQDLVMNNKNNPYIVMKAVVFKGIIEEKYKNNHVRAEKDYKLGIKIAEGFNDMGDEFKSYALYGLSRIELKKGNIKAAKDLKNEAEDLSRYGHFVE